MSVVIHRVSRSKFKLVDGVKIHTGEFAYQPFGGIFHEERDERCYRKRVAPCQRAWDRAPENLAEALFVVWWSNGAEVYQRGCNDASYYDVEPGTVVGHVWKVGRNWKYVPVEAWQRETAA